MSRSLSRFAMASFGVVLAVVGGCGGGGGNDDRPPLPAAITSVMTKPLYAQATWGLRVVDRDSGELVYELEPNRNLLIASVRKSFSVGLAIDALGPDHRFRTPVYRIGTVDTAGNLAGDLVLVASGDMSMGGRVNPDGSYAVSDLDHNDANDLKDAILTAPDPLAGYKALAAQIASAGIRHVRGDVIVDERLWDKFVFRNQFRAGPIFVNDDMVDLTIVPGAVGAPAGVVARPMSAAFDVDSTLTTGGAGSGTSLTLAPESLGCFGRLPCTGTVSGSVAVDAVGPLTGKLPLVRTYRITDPAAYARTVLIEALAANGVVVDAPTVAPNASARLPASGAYATAPRVAELVSAPYADHARHIMKVSYNLGAETALMHVGLAHGVRTQADALAAERKSLVDDFGLDPAGFSFPDGSGDGETRASNRTVTSLYTAMAKRPAFKDYLAAFPVLAVDGSLELVDGFTSDPTLRGAVGQVRAKTGTFVDSAPDPERLLIRTEAFGGYVRARSGRNLAFLLVVNDLQRQSTFDELVEVIQDLGVISAVIWRDN